MTIAPSGYMTVNYKLRADNQFAGGLSHFPNPNIALILE